MDGNSTERGKIECEAKDTPSGQRRVFLRRAGAVLFGAVLVDLAKHAFGQSTTCGNGTPDANCGTGTTGTPDNNCGQANGQNPIQDYNCNHAAGSNTFAQDNNCGTGTNQGSDSACGKAAPASGGGGNDIDNYCQQLPGGGTGKDQSCNMTPPNSDTPHTDQANTKH